ncbi:hypothetical protein SMD44_p10141 (plasmid) [Streptomyces alboflavus]|uniref:NADP-dependent oxidoreductase domain-containing protein n=1 Tax=Streptomyces alboflavus TaxID=67267 RepID=A0A291W2X3_9ACTN|nr:aldo/keto reductase [Streptomyces alboflavus]ATM24640.1 hypothetical protein SMD44_p10141 [Streptomyces alboflavus]
MTVDDLGARHLSRGVLAHPLGLHCDVAKGSHSSAYGSPRVGQFLKGLHRAVAEGATLFDTADSYGYGGSERVLGQLSRAYPDLPLQLCSKVGQIRGSSEHPYAGRHIHHQLEQTLDNLYAEQLALYTLDSFDFGPGDRYLGNAIDTMNTFREVESIKAVGMRGPIAPYTASPEEWAAQAERFLYLFRLIKPDVVWAPFNAFTPAVSLEGEDLFSFTARHGVGLVLAAPLAHGLLAGRDEVWISSRAEVGTPPAAMASLMDQVQEGLRVLRTHFGDSPGALTRLALRSSLQRADHCVVVVGFSDEAQVRQNFRCLGDPLTAAELSVVDTVYAQLRAHVQEAVPPSLVKELQA